MSNIDDEFKKQAELAEEAERERQANKGKGFTKRDYEQLNWSGLEVGKPLIFRALGEKPDLHLIEGSRPGSKVDARVVNISKIITDKGKKIRVVLPLKDIDPEHIMWRILDTVNTFDWVDKKRVFAYEGKDIFNIVNKNNLDAKAMGLEAKGWKGSQMFIMNIIDRLQMDWHREHKHTRLLSKSINISKSKKDGKEMTFITEGVPAYGFTNILSSSIMKYYGFWENYDIGAERTGLTNPANKVFNATKNPEMCGDRAKYVVAGPLTDEEKAWERYDLDHLFQPTAYTKLLNNLAKTITMIDLECGTHYMTELKSLSDEEKKKWEAEKKEQGEIGAHPDHEEDHDDEDEGSEEEARAVAQYSAPAPVVEEEEVRRPAPKTEEAGIRDISKTKAMDLPPGWNTLTDDEKSKITTTEAPADGGKTWKLTFVDGLGKTPACPECRTKSPQSFKHCPGCGLDFNFG